MQLLTSTLRPSLAAAVYTSGSRRAHRDRHTTLLHTDHRVTPATESYQLKLRDGRCVDGYHLAALQCAPGKRSLPSGRRHVGPEPRLRPVVARDPQAMQPGVLPIAGHWPRPPPPAGRRKTGALPGAARPRLFLVQEHRRARVPRHAMQLLQPRVPLDERPLEAGHVAEARPVPRALPRRQPLLPTNALSKWKILKARPRQARHTSTARHVEVKFRRAPYRTGAPVSCGALYELSDRYSATPKTCRSPQQRHC